MPAAGDSNPSWFIAKFQRSKPLPPILFPRTPCTIRQPTLIDVRKLAHFRASVKGEGAGRRIGVFLQGAAERQLHVPSQNTAAVELAGEDVTDSGVEGCVHGTLI